ncbi:MAG: hypothetical protein KC708_25800, partial [Anaerolineae bacterium]|nr:hypothetical protein [Anaerolineae bacterium]
MRTFVPVLVLMSMLLTLPGLTQAQGSYYDFPLSVVQTYTGNLAVQTSGTSFYSGVTTNSFNITIPTCAGPTNPTIVAAWLNYYTRWRSNSGDTTVPTFDNTLDVTVGSGTTTSQTAMAPTLWTGLLPGTTGGTDRNYYRNHGMIDITSQFSADYTAGSATTILIENFNLPAEVGNNSESYGVGLSVIYSCAEYPSATSTLYGGLDWFYYADTRDPIGVYSDLVCVNFAPVASPRTADIDGIFGGQANVVPPSAAYRGNRLWYLTGTASDPLPTESGNTPPAGVVATDLAAIEIGTPNSIWTSSLGQEWDRVDQSINIPANATWACLQAESSQQNGSDLGISGDLLAPIITIPTAPGQVAIGNFVWADDVTANGAFDTGETPLNGVSVQLYTSTQT